jgi:hypothetical protein
LIVDDIIDTGRALEALSAEVATREPRRVATVALVSTTSRRAPDAEPDHFALEIGDEFIYGYGLDWDGALDDAGVDHQDAEVAALVMDVSDMNSVRSAVEEPRRFAAIVGLAPSKEPRMSGPPSCRSKDHVCSPVTAVSCQAPVGPACA